MAVNVAEFRQLTKFPVSFSATIISNKEAQETKIQLPPGEALEAQGEALLSNEKIEIQNGSFPLLLKPESFKLILIKKRKNNA